MRTRGVEGWPAATAVRIEEVERNREAIAGAFAAEPPVVAAWLFGSVAAGRATGRSDVDFAVLLGAGAPAGRDVFLFLERIAERVARVLDIPETAVDVVILNRQGPVFQHTVLSEGRLVYERDRSARVRFATDVCLRYFDFKPTLDLHDRLKYGRRAP